jgi:hypothetical protein
MAEIPFEFLLFGLESARGTPLAVPTFYLNLAGVVTPKVDTYRPDESRGMLAEYYRSQIMRRWAEWSGEGPADTLTLPALLECLIKAPGVITTPATGVNARLHTYAPTMNADNLKSATLYWGDPNIQAFQGDYGMIDEITLSGDAASSDGVKCSVKGQTNCPAKVAPGSLPTMLNAPLLAPADMQLWIDTSASPIGTTAVTGRLLSADVTIPSGVTYKWMSTGVLGSQEYSAIGRKKRHAEAKFIFEVPDLVEYDLWSAHTSLKARIQFNGPIIELALRSFIQCDLYGPFDVMDWGNNQGSNRTIALNILSEYNVAAACDFSMAVQNDRATI